MTGGTDKGLELTPLIETLTKPDNANGVIPVKDLYLLAGTATDKLVPALNENSIKYYGPYNSLEELLNNAKKNLLNDNASEEVFVFSPGATSFGMFSNEFDRGNKYMAAVKDIFTL